MLSNFILKYINTNKWVLFELFYSVSNKIIIILYLFQIWNLIFGTVTLTWNNLLLLNLYANNQYISFKYRVKLFEILLFVLCICGLFRMCNTLTNDNRMCCHFGSNYWWKQENVKSQTFHKKNFFWFALIV